MVYIIVNYMYLRTKLNPSTSLPWVGRVDNARQESETCEQSENKNKNVKNMPFTVMFQYLLHNELKKRIRNMSTTLEETTILDDWESRSKHGLSWFYLSLESKYFVLFSLKDIPFIDNEIMAYEVVVADSILALQSVCRVSRSKQ